MADPQSLMKPPVDFAVPRDHFSHYQEAGWRLRGLPVGDGSSMHRPPLAPPNRPPVQFDSQPFHTDTLATPLEPGSGVMAVGSTRTNCGGRAHAYAKQELLRVQYEHAKTPYTHVPGPVTRPFNDWDRTDVLCNALRPGHRMDPTMFERLDPKQHEMHRGQGSGHRILN